jgi:hypothetical protein
MAKNFEKLILGGLHEKHAVQRGIWVPTQHLLWDQGKPRKTLIELADHHTIMKTEAAHSYEALLPTKKTWRRSSEEHSLRNHQGANPNTHNHHRQPSNCSEAKNYASYKWAYISTVKGEGKVPFQTFR